MLQNKRHQDIQECGTMGHPWLDDKMHFWRLSFFKYFFNVCINKKFYIKYGAYPESLHRK